MEGLVQSKTFPQGLRRSRHATSPTSTLHCTRKDAVLLGRCTMYAKRRDRMLLTPPVLWTYEQSTSGPAPHRLLWRWSWLLVSIGYFMAFVKDLSFEEQRGFCCTEGGDSLRPSDNLCKGQTCWLALLVTSAGEPDPGPGTA